MTPREPGPGELHPDTVPDAAPGSRLRPLTIHDLNQGVDAQLKDAFGALWVSGEISRFLRARSGHWYFTLKDSRASVSCAMFRSRNTQVRFDPADGMEVLVLAEVGVYAPQGRYQLLVHALEPRGQGAKALALEKLRKRLHTEGIFDAARKQELPRIPRRIGVVTSPDGAALRDVIRVLRRRFAGVDLLVAPATVQGKTAPAEIVRALAALDRRSMDVILLVRGGGAREDLDAFDQEAVVRAIAGCSTPLVTGIGHEIDTTLADLAADLRAATPSAAAEVIVREQQALRESVASLRAQLVRSQHLRFERTRSRLQRAMGSRGMGRVPREVQRLQMHCGELAHRQERAIKRKLTTLRSRLDRASARISPENLRLSLGMRLQQVGQRRRALEEAINASLAAHRRRLAVCLARLEALSPLAVLARGYALALKGGPSGAVVDDARRLAVGDKLHLRLAHGAADLAVERVHTSPQESEYEQE